MKENIDNLNDNEILATIYISHKTLQYYSDFVIYNKKKINNLNEKIIANLSEKFSIPIDITKKLIALEFNSRIKNLEEILDEHDASSGIPSNTSLANDCHLNEKIVANYIKNQNEKSPNSFSFSSFSSLYTYLAIKKANSLSKIIFKQNVAQILEFYNLFKKRVILNLPEGYSNAASNIINICNKYKSNELENKTLHCIIEIFETTKPRPSDYNTFFERVLKIFPSLKYENPI